MTWRWALLLVAWPVAAAPVQRVATKAEFSSTRAQKPLATTKAEFSSSKKSKPAAVPSPKLQPKQLPASKTQSSPIIGGKDKSGVSPNVLRLPSGSGSVQGMGESFEPQLNTGAFGYTVPVWLPAGRQGFRPDLALRYASTGGQGVAGLGWSFGPPFIQRQTDKGVPRYDGDDRFVWNGSEDLVEIVNSGETFPPGTSGAKYYRLKIEGAFLRLFHLDDDTWLVQSKDGTQSWFGAVPGVAGSNQATIESDAGVFRWALVRSVDSAGNEVRYRYERDGGNPYLVEVLYNNGHDGAFQHQAVIDYEDRPDPLLSYASGYQVVTARRLMGIQVFTDYEDGQGRAFVRSTSFSYRADRLGSLLDRVEVVGQGGETLPAMTFSYADVVPTNADGVQDASISLPGFGGIDAEVVPFADSPLFSVDDVRADLLDVDADGFADVFFTDLARNAGSHSYILGEGLSLNPARERLMPGGALRTLGNPNVRMLDMDGEGRTELLDMPPGTTYSSRTASCAETGGLSRACQWIETLSAGDSPLVDLSDSNPTVRLIDVNGDHAVDLVRSTGTRIEHYLSEDGEFSDEPLSTCVLWPGEPLGFDDTRVKTADMNGDGLSDIVMLREGELLWWPNRGWGVWGDGGDCEADQYGVDRERVLSYRPLFFESDFGDWHLADVNADGYADLVRVAGSTANVWLNNAGDSLTERLILEGMPFLDGLPMRLRVADVNGDGTTDLLWGSAGNYEYVDLTGEIRPGILVRADNGLGRVVDVEYRPATDFYRDDMAQDEWLRRSPVVATVVTRIAVSDRMDEVGEAENVLQRTFRYRDAVWDGVEHEFRGFLHAEATDIGDATAPTRVVETDFYAGSNDLYDGPAAEALKGLVRRTKVKNADGSTIESMVVNAYGVRTLYPGVTWAHPLASSTFAFDLLSPGGPTSVSMDELVFEGGPTVTSAIDLPSSAYQRLHREQTWDVDGNLVLDASLGREGHPEDAKRVHRAFIANPPLWIWRESRRWITGAADLPKFDERCFGYDGLSCEQVGDQGLLTLERVTVTNPPNPDVDIDALTEHDAFGQPAHLQVSGVRERWLSYDDTAQGALNYATFVTEETTSAGTPTTTETLVLRASWDAGLGSMTSWTDFDGEETTFVSDGLGRMVAVYPPGCAGASVEVEYVLSAPLSTVIERRRADCAGGFSAETHAHVDGLGRKRLVAQQAGDSSIDYVLSDYARYNARGLPIEALYPVAATSPDYQPVTGSAEQTTYDAFGRKIVQVHPDGSALAWAYGALLERESDELDVADPGGGWPTDRLRDGQGRLIEVRERLGLAGGAVQVLSTTYGYDPLDDLVRITDAGTHVTTQAFDSIGRRVSLTHPDAGTWTFAYNDAGDLVQRIDGRGALGTVSLTYDLAGRLRTQDELSKPGVEVTLHYDGAFGPGGLMPDGTPHEHTTGRLAWAQDEAGRTFFSYDARGRVAVKNVDRDGFFFKRTVSYDDMDRLTTETLPDSSTRSYAYSARSMLTSVPTYIDDVTYLPDGQLDRVLYADQAATETTYGYDVRLRLTDIDATRTAGSGKVLLDQERVLDAKGNVTDVIECVEGLRNTAAGCGDGMCVAPVETCSSCPLDCGPCGPPTCGNFVCNAPTDCTLCPGECTPAQCAPVCGDGQCFASEDCGSCPQDCGRITRNYDYDTLDRLTRVAGHPGPDLVYAYDADGTMTQGPLGTATIVNHQITDWVDAPGNRVEIDYDAGYAITVRHIAAGGGNWRTEYTHDGLGRLATAERVGSAPLGTETSVYDFEDVRARRITDPGVVGPPTREELYIAPDYELRDGVPVTYGMLGDRRAVRKQPTCTSPSIPPPVECREVIVADAQNSMRTTTLDDTQGTLVEARRYQPFGLPEAVFAGAPPAIPAHPTSDYTWLDRENDPAGLAYHLVARSYRPDLAMFLQPDPVALLGPPVVAHVPSYLNPYAYAAGNPLTRSDPNGLLPPLFVGTAHATVATSAAAAATAGSVEGSAFAASAAGYATEHYVITAAREPSLHAFHPNDTFSILERSGTVQGQVGPLPAVGVPLVAGLAAAGAVVAAEGAATGLLVRGGAAVTAAGSAALGKLGEARVRGVADIGEKALIRVAGRTRIPDGLTSRVLTEVKNVGSLSYTQQLRDFAAHASANGLRFDLWVRPTTRLSGPLMDAIEAGVINRRFIP